MYIYQLIYKCINKANELRPANLTKKSIHLEIRLLQILSVPFSIG